MKKIALVSFSDNFDMQESIYNLYEDMKSYNNEIITIGSRNLKTKIIKEKNNYLFNVPKRPGIEISTFNFIELYKIYNLLRNVDLIYFFSSHTWNLFLICLLNEKKIVVHSIHDAFPHENEKMSKNVLKYNKFVSKHVKYMVLHNNKYIQKFKDYYEYRGHVIYAPLWRRWKSFRPKDTSNKNVLFLGRVNPYKGIEYVETMAKTMKNISFNVVGKFSNEVLIYKEGLERLNNVNIVDKYVNETEMVEWIQNNEIILLPYKSATQSGVVVEAYRNSTPVVAFDVGALEEQVVNGVTGFLVEQDNLDKFIQCILNYLSLDDDKKLDMQYKCWEFGKSKYSSDIIIDELLKL